MKMLEDIVYYSQAVSDTNSIDFDKLDEELLKKGFKKVQFKALAKKVFPKVKKLKELKGDTKNPSGMVANIRRKGYRIPKKKQSKEKMEE